MRTIALILLIAAAGCGKKGDDEGKAKAADPAAKPAASPEPAAKPAAPPADPVIKPKPEETFGEGDVGVVGKNPAPWKTAAGTVTLGVLFPTSGEGESGRLVVAAPDAAGQVTEIEVATFDVNMAYGHDVELAFDADGKALVRVGESGGSGDPGYLAAWRLVWDAAASKPVIEEKGYWDGLTDPPAWAASRQPQ